MGVIPALPWVIPSRPKPTNQKLQSEQGLSMVSGPLVHDSRMTRRTVLAGRNTPDVQLANGGSLKFILHARTSVDHHHHQESRTPLELCFLGCLALVISVCLSVYLPARCLFLFLALCRLYRSTGRGGRCICMQRAHHGGTALHVGWLLASGFWLLAVGER